MGHRVQKEIELPVFVQDSSLDNAVLSENCSLCDESSDDSSCFNDGNDDPSFEEILHPDELDVTIAHGVVWFWLFEKWQSVPNEHWAWMYLVAVGDDGVPHRLWAPRLLLDDSLEYDFRHKQRLLLRPSPSREHTPSTEETVASLVLNFIHSSDFNPGHWARTSYDSSGYKDRELVRTCRLVCRDWAKRAPVGDPKLTVTNGVVLHRVEDEWQALPKRNWVWVFQEIEWWVERRQQDNVEEKYRYKCKAWYPMLLRPIDNMILSKGKGRSIMSPLRVTKEYPRIRLEPSNIGRPFLKYIRDLDDRKLYRTCRLVCREWARRYRVSKPELCNFNFSGGTMRYWIEDDWHPLPPKYWVWTIEDVEWWTERRFQVLSSQVLGRKSKGWRPKLIQDVDESILKWGFSPALATDSLEWGPGMDRLLLHQWNSSGTRIRDVPAAMKMIGSWTFGFVCRSGLDRYSCSDEERKLGRTCRLVCRDWARELPLGDPQLKVAEGVVWYHFEEGWQHLPKSYWAWTRQGLEWWMEKSQLDNVWRRDRDKCKVWYPTLIRPVDDLVRSESEDWVIASPLAITTKPRRTHLEASIGPRFLENIHNLGDRALYRTCRLVCRDWARQYPFGDRERTSLKYRGGVALYWVEKSWRVLPSTWWVWTFQAVSWWTETRHNNVMPRAHMSQQCRGKVWVMKLVHPVDDCIGQDLSIAPFPARRHRRTTSVASALPPELFRYICNAADRGSWSFRLVCRYWNKQCTPHVFANIDIKESPKRIRALWQFSRDSKWRVMLHVKTVVRVPIYNEATSRFPWLHLLTQTSLSVGFAWKRDLIEIMGPIWGGHRTIRSIHFGLPRSLPRSFSRGIRRLVLENVRFRRFDDLANLVCELPDLETLLYVGASFTSIPKELARRRPRRCRNNLRKVCLGQIGVDLAFEEWPAVPCLLTGLSLYLRVYDVASFFSDNEIARLMQLSREYSLINFEYTYASNSRKLILRSIVGVHPFGILLYSSQDTLKLGVAFDMTRSPEWEQADWQQFDDMLTTLRSKMPMAPIHTIFGFEQREKILKFAETLPSRMPAVAGVTTLNYAVGGYNDQDSEGWLQASLDSEELRGAPKESLLEVYPIEVLGSS